MEISHGLRSINSRDFAIAKCPHPLIRLLNPCRPQCGWKGRDALQQSLNQHCPHRFRKQKGFLFKNCRIHSVKLVHRTPPVNPTHDTPNKFPIKQPGSPQLAQSMGPRNTQNTRKPEGWTMRFPARVPFRGFRVFGGRSSGSLFHKGPELIPVLIANRAIRVNCHGDNVFFDCHGVIKIPIAIEELLNPHHRVIGNFSLSLGLGFKHHVFVIFITDRRHRALEICVQEKAEAISPIPSSGSDHRPFIDFLLDLRLEIRIVGGMEIDLAQLSISRNIQDALSSNSSVASQACRVLGFLASQGRDDAMVFLLGLMRYREDDLKHLEAIVESLGNCFSPVAANVLFGEINRLQSSNQTRRYLQLVIQTLSRFPKEMIQDRFWDLADDHSFSPKMRAKFREVAENFST